jgi:hypothetical protein
MNHISAVGMAWYKPENFLRLRAMFEDGHKLHRTYREWLAAAEANEKALKIKGLRVLRVDIDPDQFPEWCKAEGLKLNADARNRYASMVAHRIISGDA